MKVLSVDNIDSNDPHGYCTRYHSPVTQERFRVPWKRVKLNDDIRELHIMKNDILVPPQTTGYFNKGLLTKLIDDILRTQRLTPGLVDRAKRRLFVYRDVDNRKSTRIVPRKNTTRYSVALNFRAIRNMIGHRPYRRSYLDEARVKVEAQVRSETIAKRRLSTCSTVSCDLPLSKKIRLSPDTLPSPMGMLQIKTDDAMFSISPDKISEICKYHDKMVRQHPPKKRSVHEQHKRERNTEACRLSRRVNKLAGLVMEEQYEQRAKNNFMIVGNIVREMHYLKLLFDIVEAVQTANI